MSSLQSIFFSNTKGGNAVIEWAKLIAEYQSPAKSIEQSPYNISQIDSERQTLGIISSPKLKVLDKTFGLWTVSWQVGFQSYITGTVDIALSFYDADGFLLQKSWLYNQNVTKGQTYTFTETTVLMQGIGPKVASCDATFTLD